MTPSISVVIPVHNSASTLGSCLLSLKQSTHAPLEVIVVDDGCTDDSPRIAAAAGARVIPTGLRSGPAHARNVGAREARGEIIFFIDADVCVHEDTLGRIAEAFARDPELDALIGSYDTSPGAKDFLSQYKNLMHCFIHQQGKREACTFWSGCGAIRREVFLRHAGFDESYHRPAIEDIELGYRLKAAGHKIVLDKDVQVKHLKHWTFWNLLKTDILDRGIPWTELILRDRNMPNDLNLAISQRVSVALAFMLLGVTIAAAVYWGAYFLLPLMALLVLLLSRYWLEFATGRRSAAVLLAFWSLVGLIVWLAVRHRVKYIVYPLVLGCLILWLRHRYEERQDAWSRLLEGITAVYIVAVTIYMGAHLPYHWIIFGFFVIGALLLVLNNRFYLFLAARRGRVFALAAIPFHILYHLYNGFSLAAGVLHYGWLKLWQRDCDSLRRRPPGAQETVRKEPHLHQPTGGTGKSPG